ncbi:MAG: hypothetical protein CG446_857, partial [Methanosaeta sp. ASO1]
EAQAADDRQIEVHEGNFGWRIKTLMDGAPATHTSGMSGGL